MKTGASEMTCSEVLHEPKLDTILMVEKALIDCEEYPTRTELWKSLPKKMQYQTYKRILAYLEASGKIVYDGKKIVYAQASNPKLEALMASSVRIK